MAFNPIVDEEKCAGCEECVDVCPVDVFELQDLPEHPDTQKSVPVRADDCILCMACVTSCPTEAITVEEEQKTDNGKLNITLLSISYAVRLLLA